MAELIHNEDANNLFAYHPGDDMNRERMDERVDTMAEAGDVFDDGLG